MKLSILFTASLLFLVSAGTVSFAFDHPVTLAGQGSFMAGGSTITAPGTYDSQHPTEPAGQTYHGDHAYVFWQKPVHARKFPLVFLHGGGESGKSWETTPDGRDGFQNLFLEKRYAVYIVDQPRRGRAGRSTAPSPISTKPDEGFLFEAFRLGSYPHLHEGSEFPDAPEALEQFERQMTPNTGRYDKEIIASAMAAVFAKTGPAILVTHSQGGGPGWYTAIKSPNVRAIAAYEPGLFLFPEGEVPAPIEDQSPFGPSKYTAGAIPMDDFLKLTRIPIVIYYGDYIPDAPSGNWGSDHWRTRLIMARRFADAINRHGGDAEVIHLPDKGLQGNTHFMFSDKNNKDVARLLENWLHQKKLDI